MKNLKSKIKNEISHIIYQKIDVVIYTDCYFQNEIYESFDNMKDNIHDNLWKKIKVEYEKS